MRLPLALSRRRFVRRSLFVVAALELYRTAIGAWEWTPSLPVLGIGDGNPPSGAASGYALFDVMALLVAPCLVYGARTLTSKLEHVR